jgi:hypothetical protein
MDRSCKINATRAFASLLFSFAAAGVGAEYRCNPAPSLIDQRACEAARQGPDALRHFIQRMRVIENLYFNDYVDGETRVAWEERKARERATPNDGSPTPVASKAAP